MRDAHLLLERLGSALSGVPITADEHGSAGVLLSDGSTIGLQIDSHANDLWLYADLGALPDQPGITEELLQMQLFGRHTGGGAIAIGPGQDGSEHLVLWRALPITGLDEHSLLDILTRLAVAAATWRQALEDMVSRNSAPRDSDSPAHWLDAAPQREEAPGIDEATLKPPPGAFA